MNREELKLEGEWLDLQEALVDAKTDLNSDEYKAAVKAVDEFRAKWRTVRSYVDELNRAEPAPDNGDAVARPEPIKAKGRALDAQGKSN